MTRTVEYDPFAAGNLEQVIPATPAQKEIWAATRLGNDASCAFNESIALRFQGDLDVPALRQALHLMVDRHEALRGTFSPSDGRFSVVARCDFPLTLEDLSPLTPLLRQERLKVVRAEEVETAFDLEQGPLVRGRLLCLAPREHWFILTAHHIICDGWSMAVLLRDLAFLYSGNVPPAPQAFSDYARWMATKEGTEAHRRARQYWLDRLQGDLPVLQLPTDRPHPPMREYRADRYDHPLPLELVQALKKLGARSSASFFTVFLTSFSVFLYRLTGQEDVIVGVPAAGQSSSGMSNLVGHCVNLLPVRCTLDPAASFNKCLQQMRSHVLDAYDHQQITYGELLPHMKFRRTPGQPPMVATAFNLDQAVQGKDLPFSGLTVEYESNPRHFESFSLFINASETPGKVVLECQYNADLFDVETIRDRMESFEALLAGAVAQPEQAVSHLPMLSRSQQEKTLVKWNATSTDYSRQQTIAQLLQGQAARTPERLALTCAGTSLTYGELERRANQLAHFLTAQGVKRGMLVGLCVERSAEMVVGLLAILKTGAGYVPLDLRYPRDRLDFLLADSGAPVVVTQEKWLDLFPTNQTRAICPARDASVIATLSDAPPMTEAQPDDIAYLIYTSGSTGTPKGVAVLQANVVNLLSTMQQSPGIDDQDVMVAVTTLSFDMSVTEILLPLSVGAQLVLTSQETVSDGHQLLELVQTSKATLLQGTPAMWRMLLKAGWQGEPRLTAWCGGEALAPDLARDLFARSKALWNLYGPTETTVFSTGDHVTDLDHIRIGKPLGNTQAYILDPHREPVPVGVVGEIYLGGAGVAAGYLNRGDLTSQRFVENPYHDPFADYPNPRLYRTGDLARWHRDGTIEFLGRNDHQVKLRGYRIELEEIETILAKHPGIRQVVVAVRTDRPNDPRLVAYVVGKPERQVTATELRKHLRKHLPDYMVPQHFVELEELPLTSNGKVDRSGLPVPVASRRRAETEPPRPLSPAEKYTLRICREVLRNETVGIEDNFFQAGGNSMTAMDVLARFEEDTGTRLSPRVLIMNTFGQVAECLPGDRVALLS